MDFRLLSVKKEYRSLIDNIVKDFYIPVLSSATLYKRAVGYFSSSSLVEISRGIAKLAQNGGKIQLVASPYLSKEDIEAIDKGYETRHKILEKSLRNALLEPINYFEKERLNLLANLIATDQLDIKIAITENKKSLGLYHEKMGILYDANGNKIAFSGSMNETSFAMRINYETIDVFCSWINQSDYDRIITKENSFSSIWSNTEPNITVMEFANIKDEIIKKYKFSENNFDIDRSEFIDSQSKRSIMIENPLRALVQLPENTTLYDYQAEAISVWEQNNFRGIFDMATGTGKTITGLAGLAKLYEYTKGNLAVVIVCPFQHLVEQWVEDIELFSIKPIIGYSSSSQTDWKIRLSNSIRDQKLGVKNSNFFCFICTNATFSSRFVQDQVEKIKGNALLLVDEAHNFGAEKLLLTLSEKFNYRLALSATLERFNDETGTEKLLDYFGTKCIEYSLDRAIEEHKLTPYYYYPVLVYLSDNEWKKYSDLTREIRGCLIKDKGGGMRLNEKGKKIAIKRARLVAAAEHKISKLKEIIEPYRDESHILVYCGAANLLLGDSDDDVQEYAQDIRQIDAITSMLGNELNMKVSQFTSKEDIREREILKSQFAIGENLQALIAIKCLDEGVNIPKIKTAFILASTTNPKEYIQRRGRVLRLAEGKHAATIYDFITLPRPLDEVPYLSPEIRDIDLGLVKREITRAQEFARIAINSIQSSTVIDDIREVYELDTLFYSTQFD